MSECDLILRLGRFCRTSGSQLPHRPGPLKRQRPIRRLTLGRIQLLESQSRMKTSTTHPYRVLIADDQADIRDALRLLLKRENYETHTVASPADAISAVEAREFDAVL